MPIKALSDIHCTKGVGGGFFAHVQKGECLM